MCDRLTRSAKMQRIIAQVTPAATINGDLTTKQEIRDIRILLDSQAKAIDALTRLVNAE